MVAIFVGAGSGFERSSANLLGSAGQLGGGLIGRAGENVSVNAFSGNLIVSQQDEYLVGRGPDVGISRTYNSIASAADGDNGDQWQQSTHRRVFGLTGTLGTAGSTISRLGGDGAVLVYSWDAVAGAYISKEGAGAHDRLSHSGGEWTWTDGDSQITETYSAHGTDNWRITAKTDRSGNALSFTYAGDKLDKVTTADGGWTQYVWAGNNITEIVTGYTDLATSAAQTLTRTRYAYDASDRLVSVITDLTPEDNSVADGATYVTTYTYDGASNRIASISQTDGSLITITYDASGRVETLTQAVASGVTRTTSISYAANHTLVTGPDGQVTKLSYDAQGRLTGIEAPPATNGAAPQTVGFSYDADGNLAGVTDGEGATTTYQYDVNGNAILVTDPNNNTVERTFDAANRLITERLLGSDKHNSSAAHYSHYVYDAEGHLRYAIDASGAVMEYEYSSAGELLREISYPGHRFAAGPTALTETGMDAWVAGLGDLSSAKIVEHAYDARGSRISTTSYSIADSSGQALSGSAFRALYRTYDQAGRLVATHREGQAAQSYIYDGMGRLIASTDLDGGTTTIAFNDAGLQTTVTTASGYMSVSVFNQAGELVSMSESGTFLGGGTSTYGYDENGRMRLATDASGRSSYFVYDMAGRKVADIDHLGGLVEYVYDQAGRIVAMVQRANAVSPASLALLADPENGLELASFAPSASAGDRWSFNVYDDAGRTIRSVDGEGGVAAFEYDQSDRLIGTTYFANALSAAALDALKLDPLGPFSDPAAHADDAVSRLFYDEAGRLVGALDGEGYLTESTYDAAGQKVADIAYSAKASGDLANAVFGELRASVDASQTRISRYIYDGQGQLAYTLDALRGLTSYSYDAAGTLVSQTQYARPVTPATFDTAGVEAAIVSDAADRTSWSIYDDAGRLAYSVDAEGGVAAFAYDTSGRMIKSVQFANLHDPISALPALSAMEAWAADAAQAGDAANRVTRNWYNERGDVIYTVDAESYVKGYTYDEAGRLLSESAWPAKIVVGDATTTAQVASLAAGANNGSDDLIVLNYSFDGAGRLLTATDGAGNVTRYVYDAMGQRVDAYQADNVPGETVRTHYVYDNAGRLIQQHRDYDPGNPNAIDATVTYTYDGLGNRIAVTDANSNTTTFAYDALGQVVQSTNALNGVTSYEYDAFGNVVKATDPRGENTWLYYDRLGRLIAERDAEDYLTRTHYDRFGDVVKTERYKLPVGTPAETGVVSFTTDGVAESAFATAGEYLAYLQSVAGPREAAAVDAENHATNLQDTANQLAQTAADANLVVADIEDQIANYSGPTSVNFEAERTAALANRNAWLNDRKAWLQSANSAVNALISGTIFGLRRDILESIRDRYSREATVANQLVSSTAANKAAYINQYYDNLTWQAGNLGNDRTEALADPLSWLIARRTDLTNSINSFAGLNGSSAINNTRRELLKEWAAIHAAIYDLQNNTHSTGWPSGYQTSQIQTLFNNVQNNPSYVPNNIYSIPLYPAGYRATTVINVHFDVLDSTGGEYEGDWWQYEQLLDDLAAAQIAAALANDAADTAQDEADVAAADAVALRAEADQLQADLDAATADAHLAFAAYLQRIADGHDNEAGLAEAAAAALQATADQLALAAAAADQDVSDLETQIANYSGPTTVDFEAQRTAALANMNNWLDGREDWLKDARLAVAALMNGADGLEAEMLDRIRDHYNQERNVAGDLTGFLVTTANKSAYINQYYDNLTWKANNLGSSSAVALADPAVWLEARLQDLENGVSGLDDLLNSGGTLAFFYGTRIENTKQALKQIWLNTFQALYDLQNNTYSTGWPTTNIGWPLGAIDALYAEVQNNPSYVPANISHTSEQPADYRASTTINAYFDAVDAVGGEYDAEGSGYFQLLNALAVAQDAAALAYLAAGNAQDEADTAAAEAAALRADATVAQNAADAAFAAAQVAANSGEPTYDHIVSSTSNIVEIDLATLGEAASTSYTYDRLGRMVQRVDAEGYIEQSTYNAFGQLVSFKRYAEGTAAVDQPITSFTYDNRGQLIKSTDAVGFFEAYTYDAFGRRITHVAKSHTGALSAGGTTTFTYDKRGLLVKETLPITSYGQGSGFVENTYDYDARGNLIERNEANNKTEKRTTLYSYDHLDRLIEITHEQVDAWSIHPGTKAVSNSLQTPREQFEYDANGNLIKSTDLAGAATYHFYDELGRKTVQIDALGHYTAYTYDANGNVTKIRVFDNPVAAIPSTGGASGSAPAEPSGGKRETTFEYDALGRMASSSVLGVRTGTASGTTNWRDSTIALKTIYTYDSRGNVVRLRDPAGRVTWSYYDDLGRKIAQVDGGNYLTGWEYDSEGNVLRETRYATKVSGTVGPDEIPAATVNASDDRITEYTYDQVGNRTSEKRLNVIIRSGQGNYTTAPYSLIEYTYNGRGQVLTKTEATGDATQYTYDQGGRLVNEKLASFTGWYSDASQNATTTLTPEVVYHYDGLGNLARMVNVGNGDAATRSTFYTYGTGGRLLSIKDAQNQTRNYKYDLAGRVVLEHYARAIEGSSNPHEGIGYRYDALGRNIGQAYYRLSGGNWQFQSANTYTTMAYNAHGDVTGIAFNRTASQISSLGYQQQNKYDAAGRMWASNSGDGAWKYFGYDRNGNQTLSITSAGYDLAGVASIEDAWDLRDAVSVNATLFFYDGRNQATKVTEIGRQIDSTTSTVNLTSQRSYNAFGEVVSETDANGAKIEYDYNTMGRLLEIRSPQVQYTIETGGTVNGRPTEKFYYDISGRLTAQRDANDNLTRYTLVNGTGYGGSQALISGEIHADGGVIATLFDIHGDARWINNEVGLRTYQTFDKLGRVTQVVYPGAAGSQVTEHFTYDILGQRITRWKTFTGDVGMGFGAGNKQVTTHDIEGRIISHKAYGGDVTSYSYVWDASITTPGMATGASRFGGWTQTTTYANNKTQTEKTDLFGRLTHRNDLGGKVSNFQYDKAGRMVQMTIDGATQSYAYYNTGLVRSVTRPSGPAVTYTYDKVGNRLTETGARTQTASYDALGRMISFASTGGGVADASVQYKYDAAGNLMRSVASYSQINDNGTVGDSQTDDFWYRYDSMNRLIIDRGELSGAAGNAATEIVRRAIQAGDAPSTEIHYDKAGRRTAQLQTKHIPEQTTVDPAYYEQWYAWYYGNQGGPAPEPTYITTPAYNETTQESYSYDASGRLKEVRDGSNALLASFGYDALGRMTQKSDYQGSVNPLFSQTIAYNAKGQVTSDTVVKVKGSVTYTTAHAHQYSNVTNGDYYLGSIARTVTTSSQTGATTQQVETTYGYVWREGALQSSISKKLVGSNVTNTTSTSTYNAFGQLTSAAITDGRSRTVNFTLDENGMVILRSEQDNNPSLGDPKEVWYFFNGRQVGMVGNNGVRGSDYASSIAARDQEPNTVVQPFRGGTSGVDTADFAGGYEPITTYYQGSSGGSYTVRAGESLRSIALAVWGDADLWYKLAEANGLSGDSGLTEGQVLMLPAGIIRNSLNAGTMTPYDPGKAIGDLSPLAPVPPPPTPQAQASKKGGGCGIIGKILLAVIAVAVTIVVTAGAAAAISGKAFSATLGAMTGGAAAGGVSTGTWVAAGAIGGAVGSAASQGAAIGIGIQEKFNWKGVALGAIQGAIGAGVGVNGAFGKDGLFGAGPLAAGARGAVSNAATQGIALATGLQNKFDFTGVAAAGVGAAVGSHVGGNVRSLGRFGGTLAAGAAGAIANAATRSAIDGSSFGDGIIAAIPDVIGQAVGGALARAVNGSGSGATSAGSEQQDAAGLVGSVMGPVDPTLLMTSGELEAAFAVINRSLGDPTRGGGYTSGEYTAELAAAQSEAMGNGVFPEQYQEAVVNTFREKVIARQAADATAASAQSGNPYALADEIDPRPAPLDYDATSWAASQFELNVRKATFEANVASGVYDDGAVADLMRDALVHNQVLLDQWTTVADRAVVDLIGSVYGGVDVAKGAYRIAVNDEHTVDNYLSATAPLFGAAIGGTVKVGAKIVSPLVSKGAQAVGSTIPRIGGRLPINSKYAGQLHPSGIRFTEQGFPDFSPFAKAEVNIKGLTGVYRSDEVLANAEVGLKSTPKGFVWHHVEDGSTMQLIAKSTHNSVKHTGGAAVLRNGGFD